MAGDDFRAWDAELGEPLPAVVVAQDTDWSARPSAAAVLLFAGFLLLAVFAIGWRLGEFYAQGRLG